MSEDEKSPERRSTESGYAPAIAHKLRQALDHLPTPFPCRYACFIHPRRRSGEQGFGVITLAGESLPLSVELLASLRQVPTLLEGRAPVVLSPADPEDVMVSYSEGKWHGPQPVPRFLMKMLPIAEDNEGEAGTQSSPTDLVMRADEGFPQISLLCASRPAGWPA
jgi:hypothetical protein